MYVARRTWCEQVLLGSIILISGVLYISTNAIEYAYNGGFTVQLVTSLYTHFTLEHIFSNLVLLVVYSLIYKPINMSERYLFPVIIGIGIITNITVYYTQVLVYDSTFAIAGTSIILTSIIALSLISNSLTKQPVQLLTTLVIYTPDFITLTTTTSTNAITETIHITALILSILIYTTYQVKKSN